jgi:hypothetical protein
MSTTVLHQVSGLRMSGAIPLLPVYAVMAWTGIAQSVKWLDCKTVVQLPAAQGIHIGSATNSATVVVVSVAMFLGLRRIEREAEHSLRSSVKAGKVVNAHFHSVRRTG